MKPLNSTPLPSSTALTLPPPTSTPSSAAPLSTAYIGLGANIGARRQTLARALDLLAPSSSLDALSPLYETAPLGGPSQPPYLNAVARIQTRLSARSLLLHLLRIEQQSGRVRSQHWGPRTLDLDLLLVDDQVEISWTPPPLILPHPRLHQRRFVLQPLAHLAPQLTHPVLQRPISELLQQCPHQGTLTSLDWEPSLRPLQQGGVP